MWQTAINPVIALELLAAGTWQGAGVLGPEAFDPVPFLDRLAARGEPWHIDERIPDPLTEPASTLACHVCHSDAGWAVGGLLRGAGDADREGMTALDTPATPAAPVTTNGRSSTAGAA